MKLPMKWLSDFTDVADISIQDYTDRMTATGSKVEGWETLASDISGVLLGLIKTTEKHPDADKLTVCSVSLSPEREPLQIITAATNVFPGALVPVATDGSTLPGGVKIKKGKLRGLPSEGMFCSIAELGLTIHDMPEAIEDGILILNGICGEADLGKDVPELLGLREDVVEFEITSNRPDCLSVIGLARESAVSFGRSYSVPTPVKKPSAAKDSIDNYLKVDINAPDLCLRYAAAAVNNVKIAPSPMWMRNRLRAAGVRPINNIVDITNYVMLEYGQPMHAFDAACLDSAACNGKEGQQRHIIVRRAENGEKFKTLDHTDHTLDSGMLVIADENKPVALAGVMGGENSEIKDGTTSVIFESANFAGVEVRLAAKALGMRTESSSRFEKGMDAENVMPALIRACELVSLLGAGDVADGIIDLYPGKKAPVTLPLETERINKFLGVHISKEFMVKTLSDLGFTYDVDKNTVTAPSWRVDIGCMNDLAEEVIRIYGYNNIESSQITGAVTEGFYTERQKFIIATNAAMRATGSSEIQTFSFISPKYYDNIGIPEGDTHRRSVVISNPLGEDTSVMRTTTIPSMLEVLARNNNFGAACADLFETGCVYLPSEDKNALPDERVMLTTGAFGDGFDFYSLKGKLAALFGTLSIPGVSYAAHNGEFADYAVLFHPGRCAVVRDKNSAALGIFGQVHPSVCAGYGFAATREVYIAELDLASMLCSRELMTAYRHLPKFPASTRDFSFVCDEALTVGEIEEVMAKAAGKLTESVKLFDIFRGERIGKDKKSVAFSVTLRAPDRTLTVEEADGAAKKIVKALADKWGIELRK